MMKLEEIWVGKEIGRVVSGVRNYDLTEMETTGMFLEMKTAGTFLE